ncbi:MAG: depupylase/deamidase Dop [Acidimicrobiia bacterium]|nr:MAG: depupylase/deamidase Dop [Acidimicrobiia bacterium]
MAVPHVLGTEVEYGITITNDPSFNPVAASSSIVNAHAQGSDRIRWSYDNESPGRDARGFSLAEIPIDETDSGLVNAVLHNGARLYVDHAHPEYSTPECAEPLEATLYDKAGELIMHRAANHVNGTLRDGMRMLIHKNNSDGKGNSYGAHENYLVPRSVPFGAIVHQMTAFLVSRQIFTGSGKVGSEHGRPSVEYQLTQRADFFEEEVGLETTLKRPIINTRDEPHADPSKYRRLHVIFGDATMSEVQTFVKLGSTSLMLMALSDGALGEPIRLKDPVGAVTQVSHDISGCVALDLAEGTRTSAVELQGSYLAVLEDYVGTAGLPPVYKQVLLEWRALLEDFTIGYEAVSDRLDWAAKLSIMNAYRERDGLQWSDPKFTLLDLQYHDIDPARGLYHRLVKGGRMRSLFTTNEIASAALEPPTTTRAWFRGECLRRYPGEVVAANWDSLVFDIGQSTLVRVPMMEPLRGSRALVEELLAASPDAATLIDKLGGSDD